MSGGYREGDRAEDDSLLYDDSDNNVDEIAIMKKQFHEFQLAKSKTALSHHNIIYYISVVIFCLLFACSDVPLLFVLCKIACELFCNGSSSTLAAVGRFASGGGAMLIIALYIVPVILLTRILKHNALIISSQDEGGNDIMELFNNMRS